MLIEGSSLRRRDTDDRPDAHPDGEDSIMTDTTTASAESAARPFRIEVPQGEIDELRRRINAARWPTRELVTDRSQGVQLAAIQNLARYWATEYDWRRCEARLNALPQFKTEIDGLDIHFIHVGSAHKNALPLIMTHGWPGALRTRPTSCCRRSPATGSPASPPSSAGAPSVSDRRGRS